MTTIHTHRFIARFKVEAETPLFIGSGKKSLLKDALVQKEVNGFPMIAGTSLAGVLRHAFKENADALFGTSNSDKNGEASKLKVSSALMILENGLVSEGINIEINKLQAIQFSNKNGKSEKESVSLLDKFSNLPSRQHVRINHKGVADQENNGLFDNEVVYKGTRFIFELEVRGTKEELDNWNKIIDLVQAPTFRIGSGTRNGYGSLKVIEKFTSVFDLKAINDFESYLQFNPSLNASLLFDKVNSQVSNETTYTKYSLNLTPDSFFIFSEGFGDDEADNKPLEEEVVQYVENKIQFKKQTVIPASSIKGAISHRVAFHYNKLLKAFANGQGENTPTLGSENEAVVSLFGKAGKDQDPVAGKVYLNDFYFNDTEINNGKIFNHVAIDRFTGGAMNGALFSEKVSNLLDTNFHFDIFVKKDALSDVTIETAFENTLIDISKGLLPLGGMTTKGHGIFTGSVTKEEIELFNYNTTHD